MLPKDCMTKQYTFSGIDRTIDLTEKLSQLKKQMMSVISVYKSPFQNEKLFTNHFFISKLVV